MNLSIGEREVIEALDALEANPLWKHVLAVSLAQEAKHAAAQHENETLPAEKRAEWLHAMKKLRTLAGKVREIRENPGKFEQFLSR